MSLKNEDSLYVTLVDLTKCLKCDAVRSDCCCDEYVLQSLFLIVIPQVFDETEP